MKSKELAAGLPKRKTPGADQEVLYALFREIQSSQSLGGALFRRRSDATEAMSILWISRIRQLAQAFIATSEDVAVFAGLDQGFLSEFSKLSVKVDNLHILRDVLLKKGIVLIFERSLPGMKVDGAVFRLVTGNPVIALSLRHSRLDIFWFTLLHELAHVILHYETLNEPIIDDLEEIPVILIEKQADKLAGDSLIPRHIWRTCDAVTRPSDANVVAFAKKVGIHPAIVAGKVRRELNRHTLFTAIINEVNVRKVLLNEE
ncbi:ImmA/IrrE family metallo-endopeptidase [Collimonas sp. H4R21]|uniref:ImmA/IrrE family metallo-endopeptidase n=1 Tax=Collimonas rhizosphaerae TaxID=3126357 RepID=A0ABU9PQJ0_9BURK